MRHRRTTSPVVNIVPVSRMRHQTEHQSRGSQACIDYCRHFRQRLCCLLILPDPVRIHCVLDEASGGKQNGFQLMLVGKGIGTRFDGGYWFPVTQNEFASATSQTI